jgi:hypothetical protein
MKLSHYRQRGNEHFSVVDLLRLSSKRGRAILAAP